MSDWQRPDDETAGDGPTFEVPLDGGGAPAEAAVTQRAAPNWRKITAVSALAGVLLGIVVAVVALSAGGDEEESSPTTLDPDELSSAITVPPTLTPPTDPSVTLPPAPGERAPAGTMPTDLGLVAASVATLPPTTGSIPQPDTFRLSDGSLAALDESLPRRTTTEYAVGVDGFEQTVTITNDPITDRYLLEFDFGGDVETVVIDLDGGTTYVEDDEVPGGWATISNDEIAANVDAPDMATFVRNLQLGPIRSDTRDAWGLVQENGLVDTPDAEDLREWIVVLDAGAVPEWARYAFGPGDEAAPLPENTWIGYAVYVARDGSIRRVSGSAEFGVTSQRIVHDLEVLEEAPVVELPVIPESAPPTTAVPTTGAPTTDVPTPPAGTSG